MATTTKRPAKKAAAKPAATKATPKTTTKPVAKPAAKSAAKPGIKLPELKFPELKFPEVKFPEMKMPEMKKPDFKMPEMKMPAMPSVDLSKFDASKLADLDDKVVGVARDAAYITIGFGVLAAQKVQVKRRELGKQMTEKVQSVKFEVPTPHVDDVKHTVEQQITKLEARLDALEATLDKAVESFEHRLPDQASSLVGQAHDMAKAARKQVRGLVRSAA